MMAFTTLFKVFLFVSLMVSGSCIAGTNELDGIRQGGDGYLASYLMLKVVSGLETDMQELKAEVDLKTEVEDTQELKADMQELKVEVEEIQELKADIQELKAEVANTQELKVEVLKLKADVANTQELKAEIANLKSKYKDQPKTIFAQMQLIGTYTYKPGDRIYFTSTVANVGSAYDIRHGYFEAPCDGTYMFIATLCTSARNWVEFRIVQDNNDIGEVISGDPDYTTCASRTVVTHMKMGSKVWVEIDQVAGGTINSDHGKSSFTGVFLNNYQTP